MQEEITEMNEAHLETLFRTLAKIIGEREGVEITFKLTKKSDIEGGDCSGVSVCDGSRRM